MEILTLLRLNGKRLTALGTVGALTGAVAAAAVSRQAATYQANTTVFVSQALPEGASAFDVSPLVSDFQKAVTITQVRQTVADKLEISIDDVSVLATRNGNDGGSVEVIAEAGDATMAENISQSVSTEGMRFLAQRQVDAATAVEALRQADVDTAKEERDALLTQNQFVNPVTAYNETMARFNQLTLDRSDPTLSLTPEARVQADAEASRLRLQLPQLQSLADEYQEVEDKLADATALLKDAQQQRTNAEEVLASATTDVAISQGDTVQTSKLATMLQAFVAALVATFVAGIAFFFVADGNRRRPRTTAPAQPRPAAAGGSEPPRQSVAEAQPVAAAAPLAAAKPAPAKPTAAAPKPAATTSPSMPAAASSPRPAAAPPSTGAQDKPAAARSATTQTPVKASDPTPAPRVAETTAKPASGSTPARTAAEPVKAVEPVKAAEPVKAVADKEIDLRSSTSSSGANAATVIGSTPAGGSKNGGSAGRSDSGSSMFSRNTESSSTATKSASSGVEDKSDKADKSDADKASAGRDRDRKAAGNRRRLPGS